MHRWEKSRNKYYFDSQAINFNLSLTSLPLLSISLSTRVAVAQAVAQVVHSSEGRRFDLLLLQPVC